MIDFNADFFSLFQLPRRFQLDAAALDREYRALQAAIHPDRHSGADDAGRRLALQASARANEAYGTLRDPAARGEYLLGLQGVASLAETDTVMPMDFLAEQMDRREAIEAAQADGDHAALEAALAEIDEERAALSGRLGIALDAQQDLAGAKTAVRQLRFLDRVRDEVTDALIETEA